MNRRGTFEDALDAAIDAIRNGERMEDALARFPGRGAALRPLLEAAPFAGAAASYIAPTGRLQELFDTRVHSALGRAQWERGHKRPEPGPPPWWSRRVAFASLSLPAGVFAFALLSAGGAAAATVATTTGMSGRIAETLEHVAPEWAQGAIPGGHGGGAGPAAPPATTSVPDATATDTATAPPEQTPAPANTHGPQSMTASGIITNVRGSTFELETADGPVTVQVDANTSVTGTIAEGATADVSGAIAGDGNLHAYTVAVSGGDATPSAQDPPPQSPRDPPTDKPATPPGQAETTHTPPGEAGHTQTPPGQPNATKTPKATKTPSDQGGAGANGAGNGSGNSGSAGNENSGGNGQGSGDGSE